MCLFWMDSARAYLSFLFDSPIVMIYSLPIGYIAQTTSVYLTVFAALDCYIGLRWRRQLPSWCSPSSALLIVLSIFVISIGYNALRFAYYDLRTCQHGIGGERMLEICPSELFMLTYEVYTVYLYMVFIVGIPFTALLLLMALILWTLRNPPSDIPAADPGEGDQKYTLILVISLFLACNTLALFINFYEAFLDPEPLVLNFLTDASNFLVIFNSSVNFIIYMVFSPAFRGTVAGWVCREGRKGRPHLLLAQNGAALVYTRRDSAPLPALLLPTDSYASQYWNLSHGFTFIDEEDSSQLPAKLTPYSGGLL